MEYIPHNSAILHVLFIASEADPLVKAGGLGDVAGSLPVAISNLTDQVGTNQQVDIRLVIPFYNTIKEKNIKVEQVASFNLETTAGPVAAVIFSTCLSGVITYLISGEPITRSNDTYGTDFKSDAEKFIFFSLACLKLPGMINWRCDILHANDWHTAIAIHELKSGRFPESSLKETRTILTVHNLPFMGTGSEEALAKYCIEPSKNKNLPAWARELPLPMGMAAADQIVAVSPTYAREIMTPEYGCDLQGFLNTRRSHISGILNGIDTKSWDPATDPVIVSNYDSKTLERKVENKRAILKEFAFDYQEDTPLLVLISRMDRQKGVDIAIEGLKLIKDLPWQAILLGTGDKKLEQACEELEDEIPNKVKAAILFDTRLSRRLYAGADILMMPSRYEPCGLSQMFAMRYGCLPVARATGGLADTVVDPKLKLDATGFLFSRVDPRSFVTALRRSFLVYTQRDSWLQMQRNAMTQDFSWSRSAEQYIHLYQELVNHPE